jgi:hypothetical protein
MDWRTRSQIMRGERGFQRGLRALSAFVAREGHSRVPQAHREDGFPLGEWRAARIIEHRHGELSAGRTLAMERVAPDLVWDPLRTYQAAMIAALTGFRAREGHCDVPQRRVEQGVKLGRWLSRCRWEAGRGELSPTVLAALIAVDPGWRPEEPWFERRFESALTALRGFVAREGHARVPVTHLEGAVHLGTWVVNRRAEERRGELSPERVALLEGLDPDFFGSRHRNWPVVPGTDGMSFRFQAKLSEVVAFVAERGHLPRISARRRATGDDQEKHLARWVQRVRHLRRHGRLSAAAGIAVLAALPGFCWEPSGRDRSGVALEPEEPLVVEEGQQAQAGTADGGPPAGGVLLEG